MRADVAANAVPRRRPAEGGYARGAETRARIVEAALRVFGDEGYERASTRRIAEVAEVRPPALQYYFDSKEGLHVACAEHVLAQAGELFERLEAVNARDADAATAPRELCGLMGLLVDLTSLKKAPGVAGFMARVQTEERGPALPLIRARVLEPLQLAIARLVAAAEGSDPAEERVRLKAVLLLAQISAFSAARAGGTLAFLGWAELDEARRRTVKAALCAQVEAALSPRPPTVGTA